MSEESPSWRTIGGPSGAVIVPVACDEVVGQGLSRLLPDSAADAAIWLDAREPVRRGDLTRKRSSVRRCPWSATRFVHGFVHETLRDRARHVRRRGSA